MTVSVRRPAGLLAASIAGTGRAAVYIICSPPDQPHAAHSACRRRARRARCGGADRAGRRSPNSSARSCRCRSCSSPATSATRSSAACSWRRRCSPRCSASHRRSPREAAVHRLRRSPKKRHWALDLRLSLLVLFLLAWIAQKGGTSILIAGFGAGRDGRADRRAETALHTDARRGRGVLHPAVLRRARRAAGPGRPGRPSLAARPRRRAGGAERR